MKNLDVTNYIYGKNKPIFYQFEPTDWLSRFAVAKDIGEGGHKQYRWYQSIEDCVKFLKSTKENWFYETIEGEKPSCMYFDIEWYHDCSPFNSPEEVIENILHEFQVFSETCLNEPTLLGNWYILRAIDPKNIKFSYHLIDRSGYIVKNHLERKLLYLAFVVYLKQKSSRLFQLKNKEKQENLPLDQAVFTNWQQLRTIWSTNKNTNRPLLPVNLNGNPIKVDLDTARLYFVTYLPPDIKLRNLDSLLLNFVPTKTKLESKTKQIKQHSKTPCDWESSIKTNLACKTPLQNDGSIEFLLSCIPNSNVGGTFISRLLLVFNEVKEPLKCFRIGLQNQKIMIQ